MKTRFFDYNQNFRIQSIFRMQPIFVSSFVSRLCSFDTWILYRHAQLIKIGTWESSNCLGHSHKKKTAKSDVVWLPPLPGSIYGVIESYRGN